MLSLVVVAIFLCLLLPSQDGFDADVKDMRRRVRGDITDVEDRVKVVMDLLTTSAEGVSCGAVDT